MAQAGDSELFRRRPSPLPQPRQFATRQQPNKTKATPSVHDGPRRKRAAQKSVTQSGNRVIAATLVVRFGAASVVNQAAQFVAKIGETVSKNLQARVIPSDFDRWLIACFPFPWHARRSSTKPHTARPFLTWPTAGQLWRSNSFSLSGEYVTQVTAMGPLGFEYLSAKDDARNNC